MSDIHSSLILHSFSMSRRSICSVPLTSACLGWISTHIKVKILFALRRSPVYMLKPAISRILSLLFLQGPCYIFPCSVSKAFIVLLFSLWKSIHILINVLLNQSLKFLFSYSCIFILIHSYRLFQSTLRSFIISSLQSHSWFQSIKNHFW